jgi:hypothetical protein
MSRIYGFCAIGVAPKAAFADASQCQAAASEARTGRWSLPTTAQAITRDSLFLC